MVSPSNGWMTVAFGDVVQLNKERVQDPLSEGFDRYVGLEHLEPGDLKIRRWGNVADGTTFTNVFRSGQVLFGKRRAYQRKVAVAGFSGVCSGDIYVLTPKDDRLLPELLPFICQTDAFFDHAIGTSAGSLSPRTNWKSLASYEFALPPSDEQHRIARMLQSIQLVLERLLAVTVASEVTRRSFLTKTFDTLLADDTVPKRRLDDVGEAMMGRQRSPAYESGPSPRPYLRVANVFDGYIDTSDVKEMQFSDQEYARYRLNEGDILLNEGQSRELVGRSAIFRSEVPGACFQNTLIRFRPGEPLSAEYCQAYFQYCLYSGRFAAVAKQTTSIAHLGVQRFAAMKIPVPEREVLDEVAVVASAVAARRAAASSRVQQVRMLQQSLASNALSDAEAQQ